MFVKRSLLVCFTLGAVLSAVAAPPDSPAAAAPAKDASAPVRPEPAVATDANIGTITRLARQLKIAQMERDLRDAQKSSAQAATSQTPAAFGVPPAPPSAPVVRRVATDLPPPHPAIAQIGGMAGALHAYLADGREAQIGMRLTLGDRSVWTVRGIKPTYVAFDVCPAPGQGAAVASKRRRRDAATQDEVPVCRISNVEPLNF
jgi:hypothetical protein